jgi:serine/threonine-protein kinase
MLLVSSDPELPSMPPHDDTLDPEQLAARYVLALGEGDVLDVDELARQLPDDESRDEFRQLVADAGAIVDLLPVQVRPGIVLSGRYKVIREVGSGGMGKVFEAEDAKLKRRVAVKVLAVFGNDTFDPERQFQREAQLMAGLQHPNIVAIHEVGHDGDVTYMVMDLVRGKALGSVIQSVVKSLGGEKPRAAELLDQAIDLSMPEGMVPQVRESSWFREAARIALTVARTIESAHAHGLVHRDIKPQNILLRADGTPVVLDFGLAGLRESEGGEVTRGLFGSAAYLAPEQAVTGRVGSDPRTDVYQLGAVLYELLCLARAYPGKGVTDLLRRISVGDFILPRAIDRRIPFELEAICLRALETHPHKRYQTAADLASDLSCFLDGTELPVAARSGHIGGLLRRLRYAVRRHATLSLVTVVAALAVTTTLALGPFGAATIEGRPRFFRWTPEDFEGDVLAQLDTGAGQVVYRTESDRAHPHDLLGLDLDADEPTYVYALSAFGGSENPEWFVPMGINEVAWSELGADGSPERAAQALVGEPTGSWGMLMPAGRTRLICTQLGPWSPEVSHEGLWIFTSPEEQPRIDAWMTRMNRDYPAGKVTFEQARLAFEAAAEPELTRGSSVELTARQRASLAVDFNVADMTAWRIEDPRLHAVSFAVHKP